jgi:hypothetical protein
MHMTDKPTVAGYTVELTHIFHVTFEQPLTDAQKTVVTDLKNWWTTETGVETGKRKNPATAVVEADGSLTLDFIINYGPTPLYHDSHEIAP